MKALTIVYLILIFSIAVTVTKFVGIFISKIIDRSSAYLKVDSNQYQFIKHLIKAFTFAGIVILGIYMVPDLRSLSLSLFAGAGIFAAVIGFASQQAFSNIISGIFIVIFKPFRIGDRLKLSADQHGVVEDITLRHVVLKDFQNRRLIIPNSVISQAVVLNATIEDPKICELIEIGISYDSDIDLAKKIMVEEALNHPSCIDNRDHEQKEDKEPIVVVRVIGFSDSSVNLRIWVWAEDPPAAFKMKCDLYESIKKRFDKENIEIPFPYRTIVYKDQTSKPALLFKEYQHTDNHAQHDDDC